MTRLRRPAWLALAGFLLLLPRFGEVPAAQAVRPDPPDRFKEWLAAIRTADRARVATATTCSFAYAGPLTEAVLLGIVSHRLGGEKLAWDAGRCEVTNAGAANALLARAARKGWES